MWLSCARPAAGSSRAAHIGTQHMSSTADNATAGAERPEVPSPAAALGGALAAVGPCQRLSSHAHKEDHLEW